MSATPSADEIMSAVNDSGYLMEQTVATQLERRGFHVRTNIAFEDPDEKKSREIDVTAISRIAKSDDLQLSGFVELIVECKNSSNPFVFIARPKNDIDKSEGPREFVFPYPYQMKKEIGGGRSLVKHLSAFTHLGFDKAYVDHQNTWKAVQFCRIDRKGAGWHANHGGLYDAIFYPMAKAIVSRKKEAPRFQSKGDWRYFWFFFPLIVTSGDLFLIDSTADVPGPVSVDHVTFKRELKSGELTGSFTLTFVRQEYLSTYVEKVIDPIAALVSDLVINRPDFLTATTVPWVE